MLFNFEDDQGNKADMSLGDIEQMASGITFQLRVAAVLPPKEKSRVYIDLEQILWQVLGFKAGVEGEEVPVYVFCSFVMVLVCMLLVLFSRFVFAIQGIVVGSQTYRGETIDTNSCTFFIGLWMIVSGALFLASFVFLCAVKSVILTVPSKKDPNKRVPNKWFDRLDLFLRVSELGWDIYGMVLLFNQTGCEASQFEVFSLMVQFRFYSMIALGVFVCIYGCFLGCLGCHTK